MNGVAVQNGSFRRSFDRAGAKNVSVGSDGLAGAIELTGTRKWLTQNSEVYGEEEPADSFYKVVSGVIRAYKLVIDGRRLVGAFHLPGDIFGLEANDRRLFSTDAVVDAEILVVSREVAPEFGTG